MSEWTLWTPVENTGLELRYRLEKDCLSIDVGDSNHWVSDRPDRICTAILSWNGCLDLKLEAHFCDLTQALELGPLMTAIYALGPLIDGWEGGSAA